MTNQHPEAFESEGAARAAQLAAMCLTILEALSRLRAERLARRADDDERTAASSRAQRLADHAHARVAWSPALDDTWLHAATMEELARAWGASTSWADTDVDAHAAADRVERELHVRHPEAMVAFQSARGAGLSPGAAMQRAAPLFDRPRAIEDAALVNGGRFTRDGADHRSPSDLAPDGYPLPTCHVFSGPTAA